MGDNCNKLFLKDKFWAKSMYILSMNMEAPVFGVGGEDIPTCC